MRAALGPMVKQGGGAIVNVASVNAFFQPDGATVDYGAAKAALVNITKALSQEFGPRGIRINAVSPGPVSTDLWLGAGGVAETVATATGVDADTARAKVVASIGGFATGPLHHARGGRDARRHARLGAHRQRHRRQLPHRRRAHQDAVIARIDVIGRAARA